jgi:hypothetical protein
MKLLITMLLLSPAVYAEDKWSATNTKLELAYVIPRTLTAYQTYDEAKKGWINTKEGNTWYLGETPSPNKVLSFYAVTTYLHYGVSQTLPKGWREAWQLSTAILISLSLAHNIQVRKDF